jgi:hypothetical protein
MGPRSVTMPDPRCDFALIGAFEILAVFFANVFGVSGRRMGRFRLLRLAAISRICSSC